MSKYQRQTISPGLEGGVFDQSPPGWAAAAQEGGEQGCFKWEQNHFPISSALAEKVKWFLFVFFSLQNNFSLLGRVESERIPSCYEVLWVRKVGRGLSGDSSKGRGQLDPKPFQRVKNPCGRDLINYIYFPAGTVGNFQQSWKRIVKILF